jgi:hypothetical protein
MLFNLNNKIFIIEGDYWFQCIFYFINNNLFDNNIKYIDSFEEVCCDIFSNSFYCIKYKDGINLDLFYKNKIALYINVHSEKETKKIKEKYDNITIINTKNIINFYDLILGKNLYWEEVKKQIIDSISAKQCYMKILNFPEELIIFNTESKKLDFSILNKYDLCDAANNMYFYSDYKNKKLNFIVKYMIGSGYSENNCVSFILDNAKKSYSEKHILYSIKNIHSIKSVSENFYLSCIAIMIKNNFLNDNKWFSLLYFILDSIINNNLNRDEKDIAKRVVKKILNKKVYYV